MRFVQCGAPPVLLPNFAYHGNSFELGSALQCIDGSSGGGGVGGRQPRGDRKGPTSAEAVEKSPAVRERIARDAEGMYAHLAAFFKNALEADRKVWVTCSHCDRRTEAEIPDWTARAKAVEMMLNQGFGRPPSGDPDGGGGFILKRTIVAPDGAEIVTDGAGEGSPPPT
jgi:hypothetical protein